ncbi:hypothetical protein LBMAG39_17530 [Cyanobium sp.]|nr:hypothetical protein LBMAG39_17530 [Cyanobium sp.]
MALQRGSLKGAPLEGLRVWSERRVRPLVSLSQAVDSRRPWTVAPGALKSGLPVVNMLPAKTHLSRLVQAIESGAVAEILIARHGRPVARLTALKGPNSGIRIGLAKAPAPGQLPPEAG